VRVEVLTDRPADRFVVGSQLHPEGSADPLTVAEAWPADPGWILRFAEVSSRDAAEAYRLVYLEAEVGPADDLPEGAFYWHEMIGVAVSGPDGDPLGVVRGVYRAGDADVLEIAGGPRGDFDLPIARPFLQVLDPRRGQIVADPAALDLPAVSPSVTAASPPRPPRPPRPRRAGRRAATPPPALATGEEDSSPRIG
jgi:16S rRNA processing protein RimM